VAGCTAFFPHSGHRQGNGLPWEWGVSVILGFSGIMDAHHVNHGVARVVLNEDRFDVQQSAADIHAEVVMKVVFAPLGPRLANLIDFAAGRKEAEHFLANEAGCQSFQVLLKPLAWISTDPQGPNGFHG
jgi:ABC-type branched-subunit amino acid transport system substrate-binding protein